MIPFFSTRQAPKPPFESMKNKSVQPKLMEKYFEGYIVLKVSNV
jgi:hypothetical protein